MKLITALILAIALASSASARGHGTSHASKPAVSSSGTTLFGHPRAQSKGNGSIFGYLFTRVRHTPAIPKALAPKYPNRQAYLNSLPTWARQAIAGH